jgi:hypothetical protein
MKLRIENYKKIEGVRYSSQWNFHHVEETNNNYKFTLRYNYHSSNRNSYQHIEVNRLPDSRGRYNVLYAGDVYKFKKYYFRTITELIGAFKKYIK